MQINVSVVLLPLVSISLAAQINQPPLSFTLLSKPYLADQSTFIDSLSREADNLLPRLDSTSASGTLAVKWQGIVSDLSRYRLKSPNSSLMRLEQFVMVTAADVDRANCADTCKMHEE